MNIASLLNNREIATIVWAMALLIWVLLKQPTFYKSILSFLGTIIKLWKYFLPMLLYVIVSIFVLNKIYIWNNNFIKVTIFWFFGWAVIMFINSIKIGKENGYLKKVIFEILGLAVFVSFISNFYSFSLWFELLLVPLIATLAGVSAVASFDQKHKSVAKFTNNILVTLGFVVFSVSLYKTIVHFYDFATVDTLREFLIPILLSFMFIPFAYAFSMYSQWEQKRLQNKDNGISKK